LFRRLETGKRLLSTTAQGFGGGSGFLVLLPACRKSAALECRIG
jgi:hypothetical protein